MKVFLQGDGRKGSDAIGSEEWIYGVNPVLEALRANRDIKGLYLVSGRWGKLKGITAEAEKRNIPVTVSDPGFFDRRFPKGHQGVAARVSRKDLASLDDLLSIPSRKNEIPLFLVLDGIEDPRNLGAILRSVDAVGAHGAVIQTHRAAPLGSEVSKTSAGAVEYVSVAMVPNIKHAILRMKEEGITVIGAEADVLPSLWEVDLKIPLCVVIGSEGKGMRRTVREKCDYLVSLPMRGRVNSLNVSVAAGIILFEVLRQRLAKN